MTDKRKPIRPPSLSRIPGESGHFYAEEQQILRELEEAINNSPLQAIMRGGVALFVRWLLDECQTAQVSLTLKKKGISSATTVRELEQIARRLETLLERISKASRSAARLSTPLKRGRGRPATADKQLWIMGTIEAYRGAGLRRKAAIQRAARIWRLTDSRVEDIYKGNKLLKVTSKKFSAFLGGDTPEMVDLAIRRFLGNDPP